MSAEKKKITPARMPREDHAKKYLLDQLMTKAYPGEQLEMSLARLAMAAGYLKQRELDPVAVWLAYRKFPHLSTRPYHPKK